MKYLSTNGLSAPATLEEAVLSGMPTDGGLFLPEQLPRLNAGQVEAFKTYSFQEIAQELARAFLSEDIPEPDLSKIVERSMDLDLRLNHLDEHFSLLETYHGPTMAFKDFGARFMARLMSYLTRGSDRELTIIVATSGDTGSAVASGFFDIPGIRVVILYPSGKVSPSQEKQLTTWGGNIQALEVSGSFDDCQRMVKSAFADAELRKAHRLSSANSINIARLLPQSFYYAFTAAQLVGKEGDLVISVPSGNFGNLTAGLMAKQIGIPIHHFIASTNRNDVFPEFLDSGNFKPHASHQTISNAMDVGNPSNFDRICHLMENDFPRIQSEISSWSFDDDQTRAMIRRMFEIYNTIVDPHTAVGCLGLKKYQEEVGDAISGVVISTAHPAKFPESVEPIIEKKIPIPPPLQQYLNRQKQATPMTTNFGDFRAYLLETLG